MYNIISFDIWRITSYLASLPNIQKMHEKNDEMINNIIEKLSNKDWVDYIYKNKAIKTYRIYYIIEKFFKDLQINRFRNEPLFIYDLNIDYNINL